MSQEIPASEATTVGSLSDNAADIELFNKDLPRWNEFTYEQKIERVQLLKKAMHRIRIFERAGYYSIVAEQEAATKEQRAKQKDLEKKYAPVKREKDLNTTERRQARSAKEKAFDTLMLMPGMTEAKAKEILGIQDVPTTDYTPICNCDHRRSQHKFDKSRSCSVESCECQKFTEKGTEDDES